MGHSLGGILAREVAQLLNDNCNNEVTFVIMLDSWYFGIDDLDVNNVKHYLQVSIFILLEKKLSFAIYFMWNRYDEGITSLI